MNLIFFIFLCFLLIVGFLFDTYAIFLRLGRKKNISEYIAAANLIQYMARILNMGVIFIITFLFEIKKLEFKISFLFSLSCFFGFFVVYFFVKYRGFANFINKLISFPLYLSFPLISKRRIWKRIDLNFSRKKLNKISIFSFLINSFLIFAMFVPFGISEKFPEYRMTSVYIGQIISFFSTFLTFGLLDPNIMTSVSRGDVYKAIQNQVFGRFISYAMMSAIFMSIGVFL